MKDLRVGLTRRAAMAAAVMLLGACANLGGASAPADSQWIGAWSAPPAPPASTSRSFENETVRMAARLSAASERVRVRLSNEYGDKPLKIGAASIALAGADGATTGAILPLTFGGLASVTLPPGAPMLSDPVDLKAPALASVSVSLYLPEATGPCTCHPLARADTYVSAPGDFTRTGFVPSGAPLTSRAFLTGIDIVPATPTRTIIAFGDSITDGFGSTANANRRWPDILTERLAAAGMDRAVANAAISGNRILAQGVPAFGQAAVTRFDRDALSLPGAGWIVLLEGINDIGQGGDARPSIEVMIAGYRQLITRAHDHGLKIYAGTLLPYEGARYYSDSGEAVRQAANAWIRTGGAFDGVIDFDAVMRDPANSKKIKADLQSGDWLHPNDAGYKAMGEAIDLALFK